MSGIKPSDISKPGKQFTTIKAEDLVPLPAPYDDFNSMTLTPLNEEKTKDIEHSFDDTIAVNFPKPKTKEEEEKLVEAFLRGLEKLFQEENNWAFLQPWLLSMEHCAKCNTCSDACPVFEMTGRNEAYRPIFRSEIVRRIYKKYIKPGGKFTSKFTGDIDLNWTTVSRLMEMAYRCTLCRRCASVCPVGVDNGLINHELRKVFSMELGISPKEIHDNGSMLQLKVGSSTGMSPIVVKDNIEFIDEDMSDMTGLTVETPWDKEGADVLLIHNAGEILAWPENPGAFAILFEAAGLSWTLSSDVVAYDGINYGLWYDDVQLARVAVRHAEAAKKLGVKKIILGECGHAHKALTVIADRVLTGDLNIPRVSAMVILEEIFNSGRIKWDPSKNDFPVTLHDPCNMVRAMGVVEPQRRIIRALAPQFREMTPHGVENYCCGGGSGFAIMSGHNFAEWRNLVSARKKFLQILGAFENEPQEVDKYVCAPCSNCKGTIRDFLDFYKARERSNIYYGGLVELMVNAMAELKEPFLKFGDDPMMM